MGSNVIIYPNDGTGCGMYRLTWPGKAVAASGKSVNVMPRAPQIAVDPDGNVRGIHTGNYDTVVFQRPGSYQFSQVIPILQSKGVKVIVDMDDSLSTIHPRNVAFKSYDPRVSQKMNWMHAAKACDLADWVTVTTEALAEEYGKHGRVTVIPNHVPASYLKIERPVNEVPIVGWAGWTNTHIDDLRVTNGIINQVLIDTGAKFAAFGDEKIFFDMAIRNRPPNEHWGFSNINEYPHKLVGMDIGLVPLQKSLFNECKSWLKGLEMASLGIVPVVSPIGGNKVLIELGMALPAAKPKEWYDTVKELILDNDYRAEMSKKVRELAADLTIEGNSDKWWSVWSNVV
jgi:glycosyltransferase involved in cell wall biosynthesis